MKLRAEKPLYGGASLSHVPADDPSGLAGKTVFLPKTLPGELVEATLTEDRRSYATAQVSAILEPALARITPVCDYYGRCGGCHYQHAEYATQLAMKRDILRETLERAHVTDLPAIATRSAEPWHYRNRVRLHIAPSPRPALTYREAGSHRDLRVDHCPVAAPLLEQAIAATNRALEKQPALASSLTEVEFFTEGDGSSLLISLFTERAVRAPELARSLAQALQSELPATVSVSVFRLNAKTRRTELLHTEGAGRLHYSVGDLRYQVSAGAFFQVNRFLIPALLDLVTTGRQGAVAWDLYAGVGLFAQALAQRFERVIAVEPSALATADLAHNLRGPGHRCIVEDTRRFLNTPGRAPAPDLVVVDPPRAGLGPEVTTSLAAVAPREIAYVSCDPSTLARDLRALQPSGYRPAEITLVDLFPQTFHLETLVRLIHD